MSEIVSIYSRNMQVSDRLNDYIEKKAARLDRYLPGIEEARVDLAYVKTASSVADRQVAQITVRGKKFILRAEERAEDIFVAFDQAMDKMQRQMARYKGKRYQSQKRGDSKRLSDLAFELEDDEEFEEYEEEEAPQIVRRKKFLMTPMDEEEAIEHMTLLGHENFFVFFNFNTNSINVVYKRRDGTYGLIEPELG